MPVEVHNEQIITFPVDVKIAVMNKNPEIFQRRWNGEDYEFPPGEAVIVTTEAAMGMFAVDTRTPPGHVIKLRRDKNAGRIGTSNSWYDEARIAVGANDKKGEIFFDNFEFRLVKSTKRMSAVDFEKIPVK